MIKAVVKRFFDIGATAVALVFFGPLIVILSFFVRINLGSPVFFTQMRPGLRGLPFRLIKFRTMKDARGPDGKLLPDDQRMTPFGSFLRKSSLDELPELWNVLMGEMSLVGPRPLLMQYLERYSPRQARRHEVRPGITGWAQINGRNAVSWDERFELDVWYVENQSLALDVRILFRTVMTVLKRDGISAEGHATMPEFRGRISGDPGSPESVR